MKGEAEISSAWRTFGYFQVSVGGRADLTLATVPHDAHLRLWCLERWRKCDLLTSHVT